MWHVDFPGGSDGKESACNAGGLVSILGSGRSPGGGHGNPLQYYCLESPHGQTSLRAIVLGVTESDTPERLGTAHMWRVESWPPGQGLNPHLLGWEHSLSL